MIEKKPKAWIENTFGVKLDNKYANIQVSQNTDIYTRNYSTGGATTDDQLMELHTHYERYWNTEPAPKEAMPGAPDTGEQLSDPTVQQLPNPANDNNPEEIGGWNYRCTYLVGDKIIKEIPKLTPNMYPFAILYDYKQRKEFWGKSSAQLILDNQILVNKVESIMGMIGTLLQNPQKVIRKDAGINPEEARRYSTAPGHVWVANGDPTQAIRWQEVPQIPQALFNLAESAKANIREITGLSEAYMGQSVGSLQTSSGVNSLIDRSTLRDRDQMIDVNDYIEQLSRLLIGFIVSYYTDQRYLKVIKDSTRPNEAEFIAFLGTDFQHLDFDMSVDVSQRAPISVMKRAQEANNRLQLQGQYKLTPRLITPQEYVKDTDMADKREILDRMNMEEEFSNLQKLDTVLKSSMEALQAGMPPDQVMQMAQQHLQQIESGEAPMSADPFNPGNIPPGGAQQGQGQGGIGSAADNTGQIQNQQASLPNPQQTQNPAPPGPA